jgi:hypothetical protein
MCSPATTHLGGLQAGGAPLGRRAQGGSACRRHRDTTRPESAGREQMSTCRQNEAVTEWPEGLISP